MAKALRTLKAAVTKAEKNFSTMEDRLADVKANPGNYEKPEDALKLAEQEWEKANQVLADARAELLEAEEPSGQSQSNQASKPKSNKTGDTFTVVATADRWRSGLYFPAKQETPVEMDELTEEQVEAIRDDPVLVVKEG